MTRLPAEWEAQSFLQFTFPHKQSDWAYMLNDVSSCFVDMALSASQFQEVWVVCDQVERVKAMFPSRENIFFSAIASNDTWARDHGAITVLKNGKATLLDFTFNGWGNKFDAALDNLITPTAFQKSTFLGCGLQNIAFVLEGGAIESDGRGTLLTTSACLLNPNRNPGFSKPEMEEKLKSWMGLERVLWLDHGYLEGDDTDAHIDTLARFCNEKTIAYVGCRDTQDPHFIPLQNMKQQLQQFTTINGHPYNLIELPLPSPCYDNMGQRLPATYANFTIINGAVLVPLYKVEEDKEAVRLLENVFPDREVVGINCRPLIEQHGSLHCVTMQYPKPVELNKEKVE
jgi:agmatine deiminase